MANPSKTLTALALRLSNYISVGSFGFEFIRDIDDYDEYAGNLQTLVGSGSAVK